jgi:hypothetical protein
LKIMLNCFLDTLFDIRKNGRLLRLLIWQQC